MDSKTLLKQLHENAAFMAFVQEELVAKAPRVPPYNPATDNTERWKYDSGMRAGYAEALRMLGVTLPE